MIQRIFQSRYSQSVSRLVGWIKGWMVPTLLRRRIFGVAFIASILAIVYWGLIASDMYVSEAHVIIVRTDSPSSSSSGTGGAMGGINTSGGTADFIAFQMWLRDYMYSVDMMNALDAKLNLRAHYSDWHRDIISRMWFEDSDLEKFHSYYQSRISADLDNSSGALVIKVQAYDAKMAHAIAAMLVEEGERYMNITAQRMLEEQVSFLEKQVGIIKAEDVKAHKTLLDFQNRTGLASPLTTAASIDTVVNGLDSQRVALQASRNAMLAYLMPNNPSILALDQQIAGIDKQIKAERARLVSSRGRTLNDTSDEAMRLQMDVTIMDATYSAAISALETERIMAALMMRKVFVLQKPTMPQYPLAPRRIYSITVFILAALILAGIVQLIAAIIRDHKE